MKIAVLADTHIPKRAKALPASAWKIISEADAIIHAGDIVSENFLSSLKEIAPLYAVLGNNDLELSLPEKLEIEIEKVKIAIVHDSGQSKGRATRMKRLFPQADIVIFGHSHIPMNTTEDGQLLFNPGSPTDRRMQPKFTMGMLTLSNGKHHAEIIELD